MEESISTFQIKQSMTNSEKQRFVDRERERQKICFFRFVGGNASETEQLIKQLYWLKQKNIILLGIFRFPFCFEGKRRMQIAIDQYYKMKELSDAITYFYSDGMMEMLENNTSIVEANQRFESYEKAPIQVIEEMLHQTGDINIDVRDIIEFIRSQQGALFIRSFEGDSFDEPLKYLISSPYLPDHFTDGKQMIINVGYTADVNMNSFQQINLRLSDLFHKAEIFKLGSYMMNQSPSRLKISLIVNGIQDPYEQQRRINKGFMYRYWWMHKWDKVLKKGENLLQFSNVLYKGVGQKDEKKKFMSFWSDI